MTIDLTQLPSWIGAALAGPAVVACAAVARRVLRSHAIHFVDALLWLISRRVRHAIGASTNVRRYCERELESTKRVAIPGSEAASVDIDSIFVRLRLEQGGRSPILSSDNALALGSRVQVIGEPGSGKSSLVVRLLRETCRATIEQPLEGLLPVRVRLRDVDVPEGNGEVNREGSWFLNHIEQRVAQAAGFRMGEFFRESVDQTGLLVLLDGLDEVPTSRYSAVVDAINSLSRELARRSRHNRIVLTMRTQFHARARRDLEEEFPDTLRILPFTPADMFEFLIGWYSEDTNGARKANQVYAELITLPTLREICTSPLILSMYVANYRQGGEMSVRPETRTRLYRDVIDELLARRRGRQLSDGSPQVPRIDRRAELFGRLALENILDTSQSPNSLDWQRAVVVVAEMTGRSETESEELLRDLATATGLIHEERRGESFRFMHLTFCEFLAAHEATQGREDGWQTLMLLQREIGGLGGTSAPRLGVVIPFTVALLTRVKRLEALSEVLSLGDLELYSRCLLESQQYDHCGWEQYQASEYRRLTSTDPASWDSQWLEELRLFQVVLAEASSVTSESLWRPVSPGRSIDGLFSDLVSNDKRRLIQLFSSYAAHDPVAAFRLASVCGVNMAHEAPDLLVTACDRPAFLSLAVEASGESGEELAIWAQLLTEAALRRTLVADELTKMDPPEAVGAAAMMVPRSRRWSVSPRVASLLDLYVTIAANVRPTYRRLDAPCLHVLRDVLPPSAMRWRVTKYVVGLHLPVGLLFALGVPLGVVTLGVERGLDIAGAAVASIGLTLAALDLLLVVLGVTSIRRGFGRLFGPSELRRYEPRYTRRLGLKLVGAGELLRSGDALMYADLVPIKEPSL